MEAHKHVTASQGWYRRVGPIKLQIHVQSAIPIQDPEVHRQMTGYLQQNNLLSGVSVRHSTEFAVLKVFSTCSNLLMP